MQAFVLCEQQVDNLAIWVPETHGLGEGFDKGFEDYTFELTEEEIQRQSWYGWVTREGGRTALRVYRAI